MRNRPKPPIKLYAGSVSRAIEFCWLAAVVVVPLAIVNENWMFGSVETPKVFALRSIALSMLCLISLEQLTRDSYEPSDTQGRGASQKRLRFAMHPGKLVFIGAAGVLVVNVLSAVMSPVIAVSLTGVDVGMDSYGLFNVASYVLVFWVTATHIRSAAQIRRLLWALVITGVLMSVVGLGQQYGIDPFHDGDRWRSRIPLTVGNPIFAGSLLVITIPITLSMALSLRSQMGQKSHFAVSIALLAPQLFALLFTYSRGAWVGLAAGMTALLVTLWLTVGGPALRRAAAVLGSLAALIALTGLISPATGKELALRLSTLPHTLTDIDSSALGSRLQIWESSISAYFSGQWPNSAEFAIPSVAPQVLRELVGFGPDIYRYANFAAGGPWFTQHAHNFALHTAVELGSLGVAAYMGLGVAVLVLMYQVLRAATHRTPTDWYAFSSVGLVGALTGRVIEQMVGKAQIADLTVSWAMAAALIAMATIAVAPDRGVDTPSGPAIGGGETANRVRHRTLVQKHNAWRQLVIQVGVGLFIVLVAVFWWQTVVQPAASSVAGAGAVKQGNLGLSQRAIEGYSRGIELAPDMALNHIGLAYVRWNLAAVEQDLQKRVLLLGEAEQQLEHVIDRNPLDYRARRIQADIMTQIAELDPERRDTALHAIQILEALQPDYWGPQIQLAKLSLAMGDFGTAREIRERVMRRYPVDSQKGELRIAISELDARLRQ